MEAVCDARADDGSLTGPTAGAPCLPQQPPLVKARGLLTDSCSDDPFGLWPFSPTRLQGPQTPKEEDVQAAAFLSPQLASLSQSVLPLHLHCARTLTSPPSASSTRSISSAASSLLSPSSDASDSCSSDMHSADGNESFTFDGSDWSRNIDPSTASVSPPSFRSESATPPAMPSPPVRSLGHLQQRHVATGARFDAPAEELVRAVTAPGSSFPFCCPSTSTASTRDLRQSSHHAAFRRLPPYHPHTPSAMDIAAFASLAPMPSNVPALLSGECAAQQSWDSCAPTNGKEAHHRSVDQLDWSVPGVSPQQVVLGVTVALLLCTGAAVQAGRGFVTAGFTSHCAEELVWGLSCSFGCLAAVLAGQLVSSTRWTGALARWRPTCVPRRLTPIVFLAGALVCFSSFLFNLSQTLTSLTDGRRTLRGRVGYVPSSANVHTRLASLFPAAPTHSACPSDESFALLCRCAIVLHIVQWLFFFVLLGNRLQQRQHDAPFVPGPPSLQAKHGAGARFQPRAAWLPSLPGPASVQPIQ